MVGALLVITPTRKPMQLTIAFARSRLSVRPIQERLVERMNGLFEHGVPKDMDERNMEMDHWPTSNEAVLNDVEIAYFTQEEDVEEFLVNFIVETGIGA